MDKELIIDIADLRGSPEVFIGAAGFITAVLSKDDMVHCCTLLGIMLITWRANEDEGLDANLVESFYRSTIKTVGRVQYLEALRDLIEYTNNAADGQVRIVRNHRDEVYVEAYDER